LNQRKNLDIEYLISSQDSFAAQNNHSEKTALFISLALMHLNDDHNLSHEYVHARFGG
jgi:hypothetical protein